MAKKIYISPSSQPANKYAVGNTNEQEQCRKIAAKTVEALKRCGFDARDGMSGNMYTRVEESNAWGADAHIPIHTNAFDGKVAGFRGFYYNAGSVGHELVAAIMDSVAPITPGSSDGLSSQKGLYEVYASNAPCAYLELGFHDNAVEAQYIIDHTEELAEAICKGVCNHYGVKYLTTFLDDKPENSEHANNQEKTVVTVEMQILKEGSSGEQVKTLQRLLHTQGYGLGRINPIDGDFGSMTNTSVKVYQKDNGLEVDGIVGQETWNKLLGV